MSSSRIDYSYIILTKECSRDITLPTEVTSSQGYGFSSGHVWM